MNLNFTAEETAFRQTVREFLARSLPADIQHKILNGLILEAEDYLRWQRILHAQGWGGAAWPV